MHIQYADQFILIINYQQGVDLAFFHSGQRRCCEFVFINRFEFSGNQVTDFCVMYINTIIKRAPDIAISEDADNVVTFINYCSSTQSFP